MERKLYSIAEVSKMINDGRKLVLAGDETALNQLPNGDWVGGTIPYFVNVDEGKFTKQEIFVDDFTEVGVDFKLEKYTVDTIKNIAKNSYDNGFIVTIIPAGTACHTEYSLNSLRYDSIFNNPITGFISGLDLALLGKSKPGVYFGTNKKLEEGAVALHTQLPTTKVARVEIVNIFDENKEADTLTFTENSFIQSECLVNGKQRNLVEYLKSIEFDSQFPFTNNKGGAMINTCIQEVNEVNGTVTFYAPIFTDTAYKVALPITDYVKEFEVKQPENTNVVYSCNCILNYLYGEMEGKKPTVTGAVTFGEIAYQLLNQTMVYLVID